MKPSLIQNYLIIQSHTFSHVEYVPNSVFIRHSFLIRGELLIEPEATERRIKPIKKP